MTEHLEKLLLGMLEKLMVRAFGINLKLGTEKLKQIKKNEAMYYLWENQKSLQKGHIVEVHYLLQ